MQLFSHRFVAFCNSMKSDNEFSCHLLIVFSFYFAVRFDCFQFEFLVVYGWKDDCANTRGTRHIHKQIESNYIDWAHTFFFLSWQLNLYRRVLASPYSVLCANMYLYCFSVNSNNKIKLFAAHYCFMHGNPFIFFFFFNISSSCMSLVDFHVTLVRALFHSLHGYSARRSVGPFHMDRT